jgi:hypothetical protein
MMRSARRRKGDFKKSWSPGGGILKFWDLIGIKDLSSLIAAFFCSTYLTLPRINEVQSSGILERNNPLIYFSSLCKGIIFFHPEENLFFLKIVL